MPRQKTEWALEIVVRLTEEQKEKLFLMLRPGEQIGPGIRRIICETAPEKTILLRYRLLPHAPDWMQMGPLSAAEAADRIRSMVRAGWEVKLLEAKDEDRQPGRGIVRRAPASEETRCP